jgi:SARP family transcriptional regulator, regulator of embCAB operon
MARMLCLGPLTVEMSPTTFVVRTSVRARLLAALLASAGRVVTAASLRLELWSDTERDKPGNPHGALHAQVARLRKDFRCWGLPMTVPHRPECGGYVLEANSAYIDSLEFERMVRKARTFLGADTDLAATTARTAIRIWRGEPFSGIPLGTIGESARVRWEDLLVTAEEVLVEAELRAGRHRMVVPEIRCLLLKHPYNEVLVGQLMVALYRAGQPGVAVTEFHALRRRLVQALGAEPAPPLVRLMSAVLYHDPALLDPTIVADRLIRFPTGPARAAAGPASTCRGRTTSQLALRSS